jgi:hypothetical protein
MKAAVVPLNSSLTRSSGPQPESITTPNGHVMHVHIDNWKTHQSLFLSRCDPSIDNAF